MSARNGVQGYTAVALHDPARGVLMVKKNHGPAAVAGRWNFIGGKVEPRELVGMAAIREFREETGYTIAEGLLDWRVTLKGRNWYVAFFLVEIAFDRIEPTARFTFPQTNDAGELLGWQASPQAIPHRHGVCVPNLSWIWPLMRDASVAGPVTVLER